MEIGHFLCVSGEVKTIGLQWGRGYEIWLKALEKAGQYVVSTWSRIYLRKGKDDISEIYSCFIYFCHCREISQKFEKDKMAIMLRTCTCNSLIRSKWSPWCTFALDWDQFSPDIVAFSPLPPSHLHVVLPFSEAASSLHTLSLSCGKFPLAPGVPYLTQEQLLMFHQGHDND